MNGAVRDCSMADVGMNLCGMDLRSGMGRTIGPKYGTELMQGFSFSQGAAVAAFMAVWVCFV